MQGSGARLTPARGARRGTGARCSWGQGRVHADRCSTVITGGSDQAITCLWRVWHVNWPPGTLVRARAHPRGLVTSTPLQPRRLSTTERQPRAAVAAQAHLT